MASIVALLKTPYMAAMAFLIILTVAHTRLQVDSRDAEYIYRPQSQDIGAPLRPRYLLYYCMDPLGTPSILICSRAPSLFDSGSCLRPTTQESMYEYIPPHSPLNYDRSTQTLHRIWAVVHKLKGPLLLFPR